MQKLIPFFSSLHTHLEVNDGREIEKNPDQNTLCVVDGDRDHK